MSDQSMERFVVEDGVPHLRLDHGMRDEISSLVDEAVSTVDETGIADLTYLAVLAHRLPFRLRDAVIRFRVTGRPYGGFVITGLPVDETRLEPTPPDYTSRAKDEYTTWVETLLLLMGSLIGDPFSFATQQRGRLLLDVFPLKGHEQRQLGTSSEVLLEWHVEDAFLATRPDWLMLLGLRNPDGIATTWCPVHDIPLNANDRKVLFDSRFILLPDDSHTAALNDEIAGTAGGEAAADAFSAIAAMGKTAPRIPILTGDPDAPFVRIDPAFMDFDLDDPEAERVLSDYMDAITHRQRDVVLAPGDILLVDNKRAVHGRRPFNARYDGTDRWLKRVLLTADLRRTDGMRSGPRQRAVHTTVDNP